MVHGQTGGLGVHVEAIVENQGHELAQIRHQEMEEDPVVGQGKKQLNAVAVIALAKEVVLIGLTAILNFAMRDKEIVIMTVNARAHYNAEQITARIIMILQIQVQTAVTEQK